MRASYITERNKKHIRNFLEVRFEFIIGLGRGTDRCVVAPEPSGKYKGRDRNLISKIQELSRRLVDVVRRRTSRCGHDRQHNNGLEWPPANTSVTQQALLQLPRNRL